jgi:hypothetical protein
MRQSKTKRMLWPMFKLLALYGLYKEREAVRLSGQTLLRVQRNELKIANEI